MLYSLDRFEGEWAVLVDEEGVSRNVSRTALPEDAAEGDMLRERDGGFTPDAATAEARRAAVLRLQQKLREKNNQH